MGLAGRLASFSTRDQTGRIKFSNGRSDREVTVVLLADATDSGSYAAYSISQWAHMMSNELQQRVRVILVTNEKGFRRLTSEIQLPVIIDQEGKIREAMGVGNNQLVIFNREGRVQWVQPKLDTQPLAQIGVIVGDILDGIVVPSRLRDQWRADVETYRGVLTAEVARQNAR